jgi:hypothetical protein
MRNYESFFGRLDSIERLLFQDFQGGNALTNACFDEKHVPMKAFSFGAIQARLGSSRNKPGASPVAA